MMNSISKWLFGPSKWGERILGGFKWFLAGYIMLIGLVTPWTASMGASSTERLGFLYSSKWILALFGLAIFLCGLWLFLGKARRSRKQTGQGLMAIFLCFLFATVLNSVSLGIFDYGNLIGAAVVGFLYLRWRFKTAYVNPKHFTKDIEELIDEHNRLA